MRKFVLVLIVLLLSASAWAAVTVNCTAVDPGNTYEVIVDYTVTDSNNVRAYGIRIDVNNGATISSIDVNDKDYYIFPGSIDINDTTGEVDANGTAVAEGGVGQSYMILEMGSLYAATDPKHQTAPASSGTVCTFFTSKECVVSLSRDTDRGGVVMENGSDYASLSGTTVSYADCFPEAHPDWAEYDAVGRPPCWCYLRQCHGDADNIENVEKGKINFWVGLPDLQILAQGWYKPDTDPNYDSFICADFDRTTNTEKGILYTFRCGLPDLQIMAATWYGPNPPNPAPDANCMTVY